MRRISLLHVLTVWLLSTLIFISCGSREIGFGVMLWPDTDSAIPTGTIFPILSKSDLNQRYSVEIDETLLDVDMGRVAFFETQNAAIEYMQRYEPYTDLYARSLRTALPIRERADRMSTRVYRLRDGEIIKILYRNEEESDEAGLVDYWYEVLTADGTIGWVFGQYLELVDSAGQALGPSDSSSPVERMIAQIESRIWRPDYYRSMIRSGQVSLDRVKPEFGFVLDTESQTARITLPTHIREFTYTDSFAPTESSLEFRPDGPTILLIGTEEIRVQYQLSGQQRTSVFITMAEEIDQVIAAERERQQSILESFTRRGNTLVSTAYGTIYLQEDGSFTWDDFSRLVPTVLPNSFGGTGAFQFSVFLAPELRTAYDGALRVVQGQQKGPAFLYRLSDDGVRLVYVPEELIENDSIEREPLSPVILFYRFVSS